MPFWIEHHVTTVFDKIAILHVRSRSRSEGKMSGGRFPFGLVLWGASPIGELAETPGSGTHSVELS